MRASIASLFIINCECCFKNVRYQVCTICMPMRSIKFNLSLTDMNAWEVAVKLTEAYLTQNLKTNQLLEFLPAGFSNQKRSACQALFLGALRHGHRVNYALQKLVRKSPRAQVEAVLLVTGYEILSSGPEKSPQIVHYAVEHSKPFTSKSETGLINAVLRKLSEALNTVHPDNRPDVYFSHPRWLFKRWNKTFGLENTLKLMQWNQGTPSTYIKLYKAPGKMPHGLMPTQWKQFYKLSSASWKEHVQPLLNTGSAYIKDPSTRLATELLAPKSGEAVLDLCAAPGGKAYDSAHLMKLNGRIVVVDLPGSRVQRLSENLSMLEHPLLQWTILEQDVLELTDHTFASRQLPARYDAVMLDAPCSNTGVIQRRTDVKWRLKPGDIERCADLQTKLLSVASGLVKAGGRLVYSTCSIEAEENQGVVEAFLESEKGKRFTLEKHALSLPWETGHDGAGASLLIAKS